MSENAINFTAGGAAEPPAPSIPRRRRFGDRKDGWLCKGISPMAKVSPYIMKRRSDSQNFIRDTLEINNIDEYIKHKRAEGLKGFGLMHVLIAAYLRALTTMPRLNRFIAGQRVYARKDIQVSLTIKREMNTESPDTVLKMVFSPDATAEDVYNQITEKVESYRNDPGGSFDKTAGILNHMPGLVLKFSVWFLKLLDYFGLLPRTLTDLSPFHGSFFITSMGSLGIPPIYHHLYDFGNVPLFMSFGAKNRRYELQADGSAREVKYIDYTFVTDERICDGFYFASSLKAMVRILRDPFKLDSRPTTVMVDPDIFPRKS